MTEAPPRPEDLSLGDQINIATRSLHTRLNRNITSRLPLALPPNIATPEAYTVGLAHFAHIYLAFEQSWELLIDSFKKDEAETWVDVKPYAEMIEQSGAEERLLHQLLQDVRPDGLARTQRLHSDINALCDDKKDYLESILAESPVLLESIHHIRDTTLQQPHTLLAYAWTMYMAIFSGGRWIRAELLKTGPEFWTQTGATVVKEQEKLSFWSHPGDQDGTDIKTEFKRRLSDLEQSLTTQQRDDIVAEAVYIFEMCLRLVEELDDKFGTLPVQATGSTSSPVVTSTSSPALSNAGTSLVSSRSGLEPVTFSSQRLFGAAVVGLGLSAWVVTLSSSYFGFLL